MMDGMLPAHAFLRRTGGIALESTICCTSYLKVSPTPVR